MQKLSACRNRRSEIHRRRSTSWSCMIAICPAGPPKLMQPSLSQNQKASSSLGFAPAAASSTASRSGVGAAVGAGSTGRRATWYSGRLRRPAPAPHEERMSPALAADYDVFTTGREHAMAGRAGEGWGGRHASLPLLDDADVRAALTAP